MTVRDDARVGRGWMYASWGAFVLILVLVVILIVLLAISGATGTSDAATKNAAENAEAAEAEAAARLKAEDSTSIKARLHGLRYALTSVHPDRIEVLAEGGDTAFYERSDIHIVRNWSLLPHVDEFALTTAEEGEGGVRVVTDEARIARTVSDAAILGHTQWSREMATAVRHGETKFIAGTLAAFPFWRSARARAIYRKLSNAALTDADKSKEVAALSMLRPARVTDVVALHYVNEGEDPEDEGSVWSRAERAWRSVGAVLHREGAEWQRGPTTYTLLVTGDLRVPTSMAALSELERHCIADQVRGVGWRTTSPPGMPTHLTRNVSSGTGFLGLLGSHEAMQDPAPIEVRRVVTVVNSDRDPLQEVVAWAGAVERLFPAAAVTIVDNARDPKGRYVVNHDRKRGFSGLMGGYRYAVNSELDDMSDDEIALFLPMHWHLERGILNPFEGAPRSQGILPLLHLPVNAGSADGKAHVLGLPAPADMCVGPAFLAKGSALAQLRKEKRLDAFKAGNTGSASAEVGIAMLRDALFVEADAKAPRYKTKEDKSRTHQSLRAQASKEKMQESLDGSYGAYPFVGRPRLGQWNTMPLRNHVRVGFRSSDLR